MDNDQALILYDRKAETSRVSAFTPRIRFVNYRGLAGMELPVWGRRRLIDYELILSLRGEFEYLVHDSGERVIQHPGEVLTIRPASCTPTGCSGTPNGRFSAAFISISKARPGCRSRRSGARRFPCGRTVMPWP